MDLDTALDLLTDYQIEEYLIKRGWKKVSAGWSEARMDLWEIVWGDEHHYIHVPRDVDDKDLAFFRDRMRHFLEYVADEEHRTVRSLWKEITGREDEVEFY